MYSLTFARSASRTTEPLGTITAPSTAPSSSSAALPAAAAAAGSRSAAPTARKYARNNSERWAGLYGAKCSQLRAGNQLLEALTGNEQVLLARRFQDGEACKLHAVPGDQFAVCDLDLPGALRHHFPSGVDDEHTDIFSR